MECLRVEGMPAVACTCNCSCQPAIAWRLAGRSKPSLQMGTMAYDRRVWHGAPWGGGSATGRVMVLTMLAEHSSVAALEAGIALGSDSGMIHVLQAVDQWMGEECSPTWIC
eukprot:EG_transcript_57300